MQLSHTIIIGSKIFACTLAQGSLTHYIMSQAQKKSSASAQSVHFAIARSDILRVLSHVQSVVEKRGTIPILANIKLDVMDGQIELTATDMELAVVDRATADVTASGSTTVPAHTLYDIVRKLPEDSDVEFIESAEDNKISIRAGSSRFSISTLPVDDFPAIAEGDLPHTFVLTREECRALIEKTRFAMSTEETRYYLNGVYVHAPENADSQVLRAVATDGHRLSRVEVPLPAGASGMPGVIIPRKAIAELSKLLEESVTEVKISLSDTKIRFVCGAVILVSKLIDGSFPDYTRVIPVGNDKVLEVGAVAFAKAVDRVSVIASDKARGVKLTVGAKEVVLSATSGEQNSGEERIDASFTDEALTVGFNARYLLDVLGQIESNTVRLTLADGNAPAVVTDPADASALYVVMPMRV
jgi:DNA polymerase III subunit beta